MARSRKNKKSDDPHHIYREYDFVPNKKREHESDPVVFFKVYLFKCPCGDEKRSEWESALKGAEDGEFCDSCKDFIVPNKRLIGITPYQGNDRVFGSFKCHKCTRIWHSAYSWSNMGQECEVCKICIYPFDQNHLKRGKRNELKGHQKSLCGKCLTIKGDCTKLPKTGKNGNKNQESRKIRVRKAVGKKKTKSTENCPKSTAGAGDCNSSDLVVSGILEAFKRITLS